MSSYQRIDRISEEVRREVDKVIREELNAEILPLDVIHCAEAVYPDKTVELYFIRCILLDESALEPLDGQEFRWVDTAQLDRENFLPADLPFAALLAEFA